MPFRTWITAFASAVTLATARDQKVWTSVSIIKPPDLLDPIHFHGEFPFHYAPLWVGNPPQLQNLMISLSSSFLSLYNSECLYCPGNNTYEPTLSNTFKADSEQKWTWYNNTFRGRSASDDISFEGVLSSPNQEFGLVENLDELFFLRFREGMLGLSVYPNNETMNRYSLLQHIYKGGNLLNPVIGIKLGGDDPRLTIGALDPRDYEGEINWVQRVDSVSDFQTVIPVQEIRGRADRVLPFSYPLNAALSTFELDILIPDTSVYFRNESLIGLQSLIDTPIAGPGFSVGCDTRAEAGVQDINWGSVYLPFSVVINGVNYPVDPKDLIRPRSIFSTPTTCTTAFKNSTAGEDPVTLGLSFLRSVYLAYRFPTEDCPYGHFGFAYPRGANITSDTRSQKPNTIPQHASQCLQLTNPTSKPSYAHKNFAEKHANDQFGPVTNQKMYPIWGRPDDPPTPLIGVENLPESVIKINKTPF